MKIKLTIGIIFAAIFVFLLSSQVAFVQAQQNNNPPPITIPITFPSFKINGNVSLRVLNRFIPLPLLNVEIRLRDRNNSGEFIGYSLTDSSGNYSLLVPAGLYQVQPLHSPSFIFSPPKRYIEVKRDIDNVSFWGIIRPRGRG